ncbi:MAG TPA: ABC transporter substrate-binding protein [Solirubrobacteraceae bacterium]
MVALRRLLVAVAVLGAALAVAACGEKKDNTSPLRTRRVNLILDFFPNADHAGLYAAMADGTFARAGLDVHPIVPSDPSAPLKLLAAGKADMAISYEPEVMLARDKGLDLVSIGALVQRPLTSIIALGTTGLKPADLEGHTIGTAGIPYQSAMLKTILTHAGADPGRVKEVNVGFNLVPAMLSKRVFATLGGFWNYEGIQLERRHKAPAVIPVDRAGVPTYDELVIVARAGELRRDGPRYRTFLRALAQGYGSLRRNPAAGVDALVKANRDLDRGLQLAAVKKTLPAFFPSDRARPFGYQDPAQWAAFGRWMAANKLIKQPPAGRALTNEFLPGQGL